MGSPSVLIAQQLLDGSDILSWLQHMRGLNWPKGNLAKPLGALEGVAAGRIACTFLNYGLLYGLLLNTRLEMVLATGPSFVVLSARLLGKHPSAKQIPGAHSGICEPGLMA